MGVLRPKRFFFSPLIANATFKQTNLSCAKKEFDDNGNGDIVRFETFYCVSTVIVLKILNKFQIYY